MKRPVDKLLNDMLQAARVAAEIVDRGQEHFESDLVAQFGAYHRLDYGRVWNTLRDDIPRLRAAIERYRA